MCAKCSSDGLQFRAVPVLEVVDAVCESFSQLRFALPKKNLRAACDDCDLPFFPTSLGCLSRPASGVRAFEKERKKESKQGRKQRQRVAPTKWLLCACVWVRFVTATAAGPSTSVLENACPSPLQLCVRASRKGSIYDVGRPSLLLGGRRLPVSPSDLFRSDRAYFSGQNIDCLMWDIVKRLHSVPIACSPFHRNYLSVGFFGKSSPEARRRRFFFSYPLFYLRSFPPRASFIPFARCASGHCIFISSGIAAGTLLSLRS